MEHWLGVDWSVQRCILRRRSTCQARHPAELRRYLPTAAECDGVKPGLGSAMPAGSAAILKAPAFGRFSSTGHAMSIVESADCDHRPPGTIWPTACWTAISSRPTRPSAVLAAPDEELLDLLAAAYRVRQRLLRQHGAALLSDERQERPVPRGLQLLLAVEGLRRRDSALQPAEPRKLLAGAAAAAERQAKTYCIVISARGPNEREMAGRRDDRAGDQGSKYGLKICACLGLLTPEQAAAAEGLRRRQGEPQPQHQRRALRRDLHDAHLPGPRRHAQGRPQRRHGALLRRHHRHGRAADATSCRWRSTLRDLGVESIPVNFLNPIDGTPLAGPSELNPRYCLKVLAMFRLVNPEPRAAHRRRPRAAPRQPAAAGPVRGQLDLRRRLSHHQGPAPRGRLRDDPRPGLRGDAVDGSAAAAK